MEDNLSDGEGGNIGVARPVYVGVLLAFALLVGAYFVYRIRVVVLVLLLTLLFSIIFAGPVGYIVRRWEIGRGWATLIVFSGTGLALYLLGLAIAPIIDDQISQLFEELPALVSEVQRQAAELQRSSGVDFGRSLEPERLFERARDLLSGDTFAVAADIGG
nr:AI-2E family transporter [Rubrobacter sp.]